ncbi:MAG: hypothetical protein D6705_17380 [Deltaproteobacteria bacterium]|nr:MAG: hypothetical protein D6705_17380 [Deltaproteobacteria bacterium]
MDPLPEAPAVPVSASPVDPVVPVVAPSVAWVVPVAPVVADVPVVPVPMVLEVVDEVVPSSVDDASLPLAQAARRARTTEGSPDRNLVTGPTIAREKV